MICDAQLDITGYALNTLDPDEQAVVRRHLEQCPTCAEAVAEHLETLSAIALALPQHELPEALGRRVVAAARAEAAEVSEPLRSSHWWSRSLVAPAAALLALAAIIWAITLQLQVNEQQATLAQLNERSRRYDYVVGVLSASAMEVHQLSATTAAPGSAGRMFLDAETGNGMMMHKLPPLAEGQVYQLWFIVDGQRISGGLLRTGADGTGYTIIRAPTPRQALSGAGVTLEPAGGSVQPTSPRLIGAEFKPGTIVPELGGWS